MVLTEEQKERIRINRARALEIQRKRKLESAEASVASNGVAVGESGKTESSEESPRKRTGAMKADEKHDMGSDVELEEFEVAASKYVTRKEAMQVYLLPEASLRVLTWEEKPNPHNTKFAPMKLYNRAEVRRLARKRHGGLQGLIEERKRREEKRFQNDLEQAKCMFRR
jgi:hypothetical protein